jgi:hypothetical protein
MVLNLVLVKLLIKSRRLLPNKPKSRKNNPRETENLDSSSSEADLDDFFSTRFNEESQDNGPPNNHPRKYSRSAYPGDRTSKKAGWMIVLLNAIGELTAPSKNVLLFDRYSK